jgi:hypothetical protein
MIEITTSSSMRVKAVRDAGERGRHRMSKLSKDVPALTGPRRKDFVNRASLRKTEGRQANILNWLIDGIRLTCAGQSPAGPSEVSPPGPYVGSSEGVDHPPQASAKQRRKPANKSQKNGSA